MIYLSFKEFNLSILSRSSQRDISYLSFIDFHYYSNFWHNVLFFTGLAFISSIILTLCKGIFLIIHRKKIRELEEYQQRIKVIEEFRPTKLKEWIVYFLIFIIYMSIFITYSDRLDANIVGVSLIGICFVIIFVFADSMMDKYS